MYIAAITGIFLSSLVNAYLAVDSVNRPFNWSFLQVLLRPRELLITFAMLLISLIIYEKYSLSVTFIKYAVLFAILITISIVDVKSMQIPNSLVIAGILTGLIFSSVTGPMEAIFRVLAGFAAGFIFLIISWLSKGGVGMGDVKLMVVIGIYMGLGLTFNILILSVIIGGIAAAAMLLTKKTDRKGTIPFAPFVLIGTVIMVLLG